MPGKKSRIRSPIFTGALLAVLAMSSGSALADDKNKGKKPDDGGPKKEWNGGGPKKGQNGGGSVAVPEIDAGAGGDALALLVGGVLLAGERVRSLRKH
jgi:hypothetical protein